MEGLHDRPRAGRPEGLTPGQQAALKAWVLRGPDPERDGVSAWRVVDIRDHAEEAHGVRCSEWGMARLLNGWVSRARRLDPGIRRAARPSGPRSTNGLGSKLEEIAAAHPDAQVQLRCEDG